MSDKTYNHAFTVAFSVPDSEFGDPVACLNHEPIKVIKALIARAMDIYEIDELTEACESFDTYCNEE